MLLDAEITATVFVKIHATMDASIAVLVDAPDAVLDVLVPVLEHAMHSAQITAMLVAGDLVTNRIAT